MENYRRRERKHDIPAEWYQVVTPVYLAYWKTELASHPDSSFASWLCNGFNRGFNIGFSEDAPELRSSHSNMLSAAEHPQVVSDYLAKELNSEHLLLANSSAEGFTRQVNILVSPLGVIPKKGRPNCWRLIMDLSAPL